MAATAKIDTLQDLVRALDEFAGQQPDPQLVPPTPGAVGAAAETDRFHRRDRQALRHVEARLDRIQDDLGLLKGGHARNVAERQAGLIAEALGLEYVRTLTFDAVRDMVRSHDTSDLAANDLRSFRLADLILEGTDSQGASCYVAVEISFTVNGRDTTRALRNARVPEQVYRAACIRRGRRRTGR